jgi:hypothetical protein
LQGLDGEARRGKGQGKGKGKVKKDSAGLVEKAEDAVDFYDQEELMEYNPEAQEITERWVSAPLSELHCLHIRLICLHSAYLYVCWKYHSTAFT